MPSLFLWCYKERERGERECTCVYTVCVLICFLSVDQCNCGLFIVVVSSLKSDVHAPHGVHVRACVCTLSFFLSLSFKYFKRRRDKRNNYCASGCRIFTNLRKGEGVIQYVQHWKLSNYTVLYCILYCLCVCVCVAFVYVYCSVFVCV